MGQTPYLTIIFSCFLWEQFCKTISNWLIFIKTILSNDSRYRAKRWSLTTHCMPCCWMLPFWLAMVISKGSTDWRIWSKTKYDLLKQLHSDESHSRSNTNDAKPSNRFKQSEHNVQNRTCCGRVVTHPQRGLASTAWKWLTSDFILINNFKSVDNLILSAMLLFFASKGLNNKWQMVDTHTTLYNQQNIYSSRMAASVSS